MTEVARGAVAVLSRHWGHPHDEAAFAMRGVAAAISRLADVEILVPGSPGPPVADGAFDTTAIGEAGAATGWPTPDHCDWPRYDFSLAVTDADDRAGAALAARHLRDGRLVSLSSGSPSGHPQDHETRAPSTDALVLGVPEGPATSRHVGMHVPINPLAARQPHVGLGFGDYVLVLSDRTSSDGSESPLTPHAAWLAARFADRHVIVVEDAVASVWRWRSLRGAIHVDTRMDLWRLIAHARVLVDLAPGSLMARECVESLRYGIPIVVPAGTPAARLAQRGGGLAFQDPAELLGSVEALDDEVLRQVLSDQGQRVATEWYGDGLRFLERMGAALGGWLT